MEYIECTKLYSISHSFPNHSSVGKARGTHVSGHGFNDQATPLPISISRVCVPKSNLGILWLYLGFGLGIGNELS